MWNENRKITANKVYLSASGSLHSAYPFFFNVLEKFVFDCLISHKAETRAVIRKKNIQTRKIDT
jgi:hypothetical protein